MARACAESARTAGLAGRRRQSFDTSSPRKTAVKTDLAPTFSTPTNYNITLQNI